MPFARPMFLWRRLVKIYRRWNAALIRIQILFITKSTVTFFLLDRFRSEWYQKIPWSKVIQIISVIVGFGWAVWKLSSILSVRSSKAKCGAYSNTNITRHKINCNFFLLDWFRSKWYQKIPRSQAIQIISVIVVFGWTVWKLSSI